MLLIMFLVFLLIAVIPAAISVKRSIRLATKMREVDKGVYSQTTEFPTKKLIFPIAWVIGVFVSSAILTWTLGLWVDYLWFDEVGATVRFWTEFTTEWSVFLVSFVVFAVLFEINIRATKIEYGEQGQLFGKNKMRSLTKLFAFPISLVLVFVISSWFSSDWQAMLLWWHQVPFGSADPIFGKDIAFYIFSLPFLLSVVNTIPFILLFAAISGLISYSGHFIDLADSGAYNEEDKKTKAEIKHKLVDHILSHGAVLIAIFMLYLLAITYLHRFSILASERGVVFGAGYTDVNFDLPMHWVMMFALLVSTFFLILAFKAKEVKTTIKRTVTAVAIPVAVLVLGFGLASMIFQYAFVTNNEMQMETQFLEYDLQYTKDAFKLSSMTKKDFPVATTMSQGATANDASTLSNIRLWTPETLAAVNQNRQSFRTYYNFADIDIDRYMINGKSEEVMLSARELDSDKLPTQTWQNKHMQYTHGYGVVMAPVNASTVEGSPNYLIRDIASKSDVPSLQITQPRIYFGELTKYHAYVGAGVDEFDYPEGENNASFNYDGPAGIPIGNYLRRFAIALQYDGIRLMTASGITSESRILFNRSITQRIQKIAPFITYDSDIYQVIADGQLYFVVDGYTKSDYYPYSKPASNGSNYIRNSVKVVVNAYTGKVDLYVADGSDPIIQTYQRIYPGLFVSLDTMSPALRAHLRYPEHLLKMQAETLASYHMTNAHIFYQKEDKWQISSTGSLDGKTHQLEPYYVNMRLPDSKTAESEFMLVLPFSPVSNDPKKPERNNLVGWLVGRSDSENYGQLDLYMFAKDKEIHGPLMIWNRIMQDEFISKDLTLWNKEGSKVVPGNLMVVPLSNNQLIYVQSIFIQSTSSPMPELRKVVVATSDRMVYRNTLQESLAEFFGAKQVAKTADAPTSTQSTSTSTDSELSKKAKQAAQLFEDYQKANAEGDYKRAGEILAQIREIVISAGQ